MTPVLLPPQATSSLAPHRLQTVTSLRATAHRVRGTGRVHSLLLPATSKLRAASGSGLQEVSTQLPSSWLRASYEKPQDQGCRTCPLPPPPSHLLPGYELLRAWHPASHAPHHSGDPDPHQPIAQATSTTPSLRSRAFPSVTTSQSRSQPHHSQGFSYELRATHESPRA